MGLLSGALKPYGGVLAERSTGIAPAGIPRDQDERQWPLVGDARPETGLTASRTSIPLPWAGF